MQRLENTVQRYAWGDTAAIPRLLGTAPDGDPQAELWMGAHPLAPSRAAGMPLDELIMTDRTAMLGTRVAERFGRLPFLLKVLAAAKPLSLQVHPSMEQAVAGFGREDALGVPLDASFRSYKDPSHKPELVCALTPFTALCGFRPIERTKALLTDLGLADLIELEDLNGEVGRLLRLERDEQADIAERVVSACKGKRHPECQWALRIANAYPGDVGVLVALLLNLVELKPQQAIYLPAGNLHAYLEGTAVEIMASSDNVLRGGLTPKHVDVDELQHVLDDSPIEVDVLGGARRDASETVYVTPAAEFELSRIDVPTGATWEAKTDGPEIVLFTEGGRRGLSFFVPASEPSYVIVGPATAYRAKVPSASN
ncbi:MAG: mannose-6-phosphate isomerase, class I [Acidimicrobiia bacterium]